MSILEILRSNQSDSEKIAALKESLKREVSLDLSMEPINDSALMNLIQALEDNHTLTSLSLGYRRLADVSLGALAQAIKKHKKIERLHLLSTIPSSAVMELRKIRFQDEDEEEREGRYAILFKTFLSCELTHLSLCDFSIDLKDMQALAQGLSVNAHLKSLDLRGNGINTEEAKVLAQGLVNNTTLTSLNISHNLVGSGVSYLIEVIKSKKNFNAFSCSCLNDTYEFDLFCLERLIKNPDLRELEFSSTAKMKTVEAFYALIKNNKTLHTLRIDGLCHFSKDIPALSRALIKNRTIKTLDLSFSRADLQHHCNNRNSKIYDDYRLLFQALGQNKNLTSLKLKNIALHEVFVQKLTHILKRNKCLTELEIDCKINDQGIVVLADFLMHNSTLKRLTVRPESPINFKPIIKSLTTNSSLTALELDHGYHDSETVRLLSEVLKNNHKLIELNLASNGSVLKSSPQLYSELISRHENLCTSEWMPGLNLHHHSLEQQRPDLMALGPFLARNRSSLYTHEIKQFAQAIPPYFPLDISRIIAAYAGLPPEATISAPVSFLTRFQDRINQLWIQFKHLIKGCILKLNNLVKTPIQTQGALANASKNKPLRRPQSTISSKQAKNTALPHHTVSSTIDTSDTDPKRHLSRIQKNRVMN